MNDDYTLNIINKLLEYLLLQRLSRIDNGHTALTTNAIDVFDNKMNVFKQVFHLGTFLSFLHFSLKMKTAKNLLIDIKASLIFEMVSALVCDFKFYHYCNP